MLDIGRHIDSVHSDDVGETILGVINSVKRNKIRRYTGINDGYLILSVANSIEGMGAMTDRKWRIIALGMIWSVASTANEDPIIEFGISGNYDAFGKMSSTITGGEKFNAGDHQKYDPLDLLAPEAIAETSATLVVTWTAGVEFGVWQKTGKELFAVEAAVAGMTTGYITPYVLAEIDTGGKW